MCNCDAGPSDASPPLSIASLGWLVHLRVSNEVIKAVGRGKAFEVFWQHDAYRRVAKEYQCFVTRR